MHCRLSVLPEAPQDRRGSVFILCLWTLTILSVLAIGLSGTVRQRVLICQRLEAKERLRGMLESSIKRFLDEIRRGTTSSSPIWYNPNLYSKTYSFGTSSVRLEIEDLSDRIDLNSAEAYVLTNLIQMQTSLEPKDAARLASAIIDYRDSDDWILEYYDRGSEKESYAQAGLMSGPKNGAFEFDAELLGVIGMTKDIYDAIHKYITIYGDGRLNINTASRQTLLAVDLPPPLVDKILSLRQRPAPKGALPFIFEDPAKIEKELEQAYGLTEQEKSALVHAIRFAHLSTKAGCYRIRAVGQLAGSKGVGEVLCVYSAEKGIQSWMEG